MVKQQLGQICYDLERRFHGYTFTWMYESGDYEAFIDMQGPCGPFLIKPKRRFVVPDEAVSFVPIRQTEQQIIAYCVKVDVGLLARYFDNLRADIGIKFEAAIEESKRRLYLEAGADEEGREVA